jgi:hypothetical protein
MSPLGKLVFGITVIAGFVYIAAAYAYPIYMTLNQ